MKAYGRARVSDFLGDAVVYRNLQPLDPALPSLADVRAEIGLPAGVVPRKSTPEYAAVIVRILRAARPTLKRVLFLGDTRLNDGRAFANICAAGDWTGLAFIGAECSNESPAYDVEQLDERARLYAANRWAALPEFDAWREAQGFRVDGDTAVLIDLDKTTLGARGRNDHVIDRVRVEAAFQTIRALLGDEFDPDAFETAYHSLNQVEFHPFTTDNQDYLVYLCLILGGGVFTLDRLIDEIRSGEMPSFEGFLAEVSGRAAELSPALREIHREVAARVEAGDPTPFKAFRRNEYLATAARMGQLDAKTPVEQKLSEEIVLTREVQVQALAWGEAGALLFGLSDKPDEASVPAPEQAAQGAQPIHRIETDVVGE